MAEKPAAAREINGMEGHSAGSGRRVTGPSVRAAQKQFEMVAGHRSGARRMIGGSIADLRRVGKSGSDLLATNFFSLSVIARPARIIPSARARRRVGRSRLHTFIFETSVPHGSIKTTTPVATADATNARAGRPGSAADLRWHPLLDRAPLRRLPAIFRCRP